MDLSATALVWPILGPAVTSETELENEIQAPLSESPRTSGCGVGESWLLPISRTVRRQSTMTGGQSLAPRMVTLMATEARIAWQSTTI